MGEENGDIYTGWNNRSTPTEWVHQVTVFLFFSPSLCFWRQIFLQKAIMIAIICPLHTGLLSSPVIYSQMQSLHPRPLPKSILPWLEHSISLRIYHPAGMELLSSAVCNTQRVQKAAVRFIVVPPDLRVLSVSDQFACNRALRYKNSFLSALFLQNKYICVCVYNLLFQGHTFLWCRKQCKEENMWNNSAGIQLCESKPTSAMWK